MKYRVDVRVDVVDGFVRPATIYPRMFDSNRFRSNSKYLPKGLTNSTNRRCHTRSRGTRE